MKQTNWHLRDLAAFYPGTAAESLPLIVETSRILPQADMGMIHRHLDFVALLIVRRGRGRHLLNGAAYGISRGDVYVMGLGTAHQWAEFHDLVIASFYFSPEIFDAATLNMLRGTPGFLPLFVEEPLRSGAGETGNEEEGRRWLHLTPEEHTRIEAEIAEMTAEWEAGTPLGTLLTRGLFLRLLAHLSQIFTAHQQHGILTRQAGARDATVAAALTYMEAHFTEDLRVESVAASVFLSPAHFREVFASAMGCTPRDYLRLLRVERAKALLAQTDRPITEIGLASGLSDPAYFARVFRAETGMTPREYRRQKAG